MSQTGKSAILHFFENKKTTKDVANGFKINEKHIIDILKYAQSEWKECQDKKKRNTIVDTFDDDSIRFHSMMILFVEGNLGKSLFTWQPYTCSLVFH